MTVRDWLQYRGEGPWDFTPQPDKWGYLNNPRWTAAPGPKVSYSGREDEEPQIWTPYEPSGVPTGSKQHIPCGHWHRGEGLAPDVYDVMLFRVTDPWLAYGSIQSLFFNTETKKLSLVDYYISSPGIGGIEVVDQSVFTLKGDYENSSLLELDKDLSVVSDNDVFSQSDLMSVRTYHIANYEGKLYCSSSAAYRPTKVSVVNHAALSKEARFTPGFVYTASDGSLWAWQSDFSIGWGSATHYPITGTPPYYNSASDPLIDGEHDGPLDTWGDGSPRQSSGSQQSISVKNNIVYISAAASAAPVIYAYKVDTYERIAYTRPTNYASSIHKSDNGFVYSAAGAADWFEIQKLTSLLVHEDDVNVTEAYTGTSNGVGRVLYAYQLCDLGSYIAVGTGSYVSSDCGVVLLDADLGFVDFFKFSDEGISSGGAQCVVSYGNFLFVGEHSHVTVLELVGSSLVFCDRVKVEFDGGSIDVGFTSKWMKLMSVLRE